MHQESLFELSQQERVLAHVLDYYLKKKSCSDTKLQVVSDSTTGSDFFGT